MYHYYRATLHNKDGLRTYHHIIRNLFVKRSEIIDWYLLLKEATYKPLRTGYIYRPGIRYGK